MNNRNLPRYARVCAVALAAFGGLVAIGGCDKNGTTAAPAAPETAKGSAAGATGVVDLDAVAEQVGWKAQIDKDSETARSELARRVTSFANEVNDKVKQHKADLIKSAKLSSQQADDLNKNQNLDKLPLTKEQLNKLVLVLQNAQLYVRNVDQYAGQVLQQRRNEILQSYRNATKPIVRQVAEQHGLTMVLLKNDSIFYSSPSIEVTDKVIDEVRKAPPPITYPSMPKLDLPAVNLGETPEAPTTGPATAPSATRPAQ